MTSTLDRVTRRVGAGTGISGLHGLSERRGLSELRGGSSSGKDAGQEHAVEEKGDTVAPHGDARQVKDALSFLRDFSYGGGFRPKGFGDARDAGQGGTANGFEDSHGRTWPNPFSEN